MNQADFTVTMLVNQTPHEVFNAVNNVRGWWSETLEGDTHHAQDEFVYRYKDLHYSKHRLTEVVPDKKVVWLITDSRLSFLRHDPEEWTGTTISFEITPKNDQTELRFIHHGLLPEIECYDACSNAWSRYLNSLRSLITTGKGQPHKKE
ncbi:SRPBCC family protein [Chitinophaga varians]|uniref:SRPBCC family protein n=1 Tax=Chitinophaga varians TaxID=2202339 RepID=UPI00165FC6B3|nr:SRPBCC domain-containing protein [Chitinophaga varians]MBC9909941.1 SRPBCC domain-containing protein [Chitinophaga varians]